MFRYRARPVEGVEVPRFGEGSDRSDLARVSDQLHTGERRLCLLRLCLHVMVYLV